MAVKRIKLWDHSVINGLSTQKVTKLSCSRFVSKELRFVFCTHNIEMIQDSFCARSSLLCDFNQDVYGPIEMVLSCCIMRGQVDSISLYARVVFATPRIALSSEVIAFFYAPHVRRAAK